MFVNGPFKIRLSVGRYGVRSVACDCKAASPHFLHAAWNALQVCRHFYCALLAARI